jgi:hypothetical protein
MIDAESFAAEWIAAWNAHDLDRILSHYADDIEIRTPRAVAITGDGVVRGRAALATYWDRALALLPDLHFSFEACLVGHDALTILYRNERGQHCAETVRFDSAGKVVQSIVCYRD